MGIDALTAGIGLLSFGIFLLIHLITFRWVRPEHLLKALLNCVIVTMGCPLLLMGFSYIGGITQAVPEVWALATVMAVLIHGFLCFFYVLCIFGPYETSVRMRLVREIAAVPNGVSMDELLGRYNERVMVDIRLKRLLGSGDIIEKDRRYQIGRQGNFFFIFDAIAGVIKKWISR